MMLIKEWSELFLFVFLNKLYRYKREGNKKVGKDLEKEKMIQEFKKVVTEEKGYTLIEILNLLAGIAGLIILLFITISFFYILFGFFIEGNFYFTSESVLRELQVDHPQVSKILKIERRPFIDSKIIVLEGGKKKEYCLDTNIFFNYKFKECKHTNYSFSLYSFKK